MSSKKLGWWLLALVAISIPAMAFAQEESVLEARGNGSGVNEAGIPVGAFLFSPTLELIYEHKDNIFLAEKGDCVGQLFGKCSDSVYLVRPRLMLELPVAENYFRVVYMPQWRDYKDYGLDDHWTHWVDFQAQVDTPSGFELKLDNRLVRGVMETPEFDPGREVLFGASPFLKDRANVLIGYAITETDQLGVDMTYTTTSFDDPTSVFYDFDTFEGGAKYRRNLGPLLNMSFGVGGIHNSVSNTDDFRNFDGFYGRATMDGEIAPNLSGTIMFGYEKRRFDRMEGTGIRQEFSGVTIDTNLKYAISEGTSLEFELGRTPYLSAFGDNAFYVSDHLGVFAATNLYGGLFATFAAYWSNNDYRRRSEAPYASKKRSDDILRISAGVGYHFTDMLSLRANYRYEDRDSNIKAADLLHPGFSYKANTILVNLVVGY